MMCEHETKDVQLLCHSAKSEPVHRTTKKTPIGSLYSSSVAISAESVEEEETKWVPDHKHRHCMLCINEFSMLNRKHHCRKCGALICSDCSRNQWRLNHKYERVCDSCFATLSNRTPTVAHCYPHLRVLSVPNFFSWLRLFHKSWLRSRYPHKYQQHQQLSTVSTSRTPLVVVQTGLLYINIMEAYGLPDCDLFSEPDGYCIYYVTNNDPYFGQSTKYSTKVQHDTYEPQWNEDETIVITNTTGSLCIELWDYDFEGSDDYLGQVQIKLNDLFLHFACRQPMHRIIDDWFEVRLAEPFKRKTPAQNDTKQARVCTPQSLTRKYTSTSGILQIPDGDTSNLNITPIYKKLATMPLLTLSDTMSDDVFAGKCYIHLQLKLKATFWGHFLSMFDPVLPPLPRREPFDINRFYKELNTMLSYIYPLIDSSQSALDTLFWIKYMWASLYVLIFVYCVFHPWFAVFWLQFRLLLFSCHSYLEQMDHIHAELPLVLHYFCVSFGSIPTLFEHISTKHQELVDKDTKAEDKTATSPESVAAEEEITMSAFRRIVGNNIVRVSRLRDNLKWYQELLVWCNQTIEYLLDAVSWKYVSITSVIVTCLSISCLLLILCRNTALYQYQILLIGGGIMTYFSKPVQFLQWFYFGTSRWYREFYAPYREFMHRIVASDPYVSDDDDDDDDDDEQTQYWILNKITHVWRLCFQLLSGMVILMKPLFDNSHDHMSVKQNPALTTSKSEPMKKQDPLKRRGIRHSESLYLSSKAISAESKRKTMSKQPTLLRKRTLKQIENKADNKIGSMLHKLNQAKKLSV